MQDLWNSSVLIQFGNEGINTSTNKHELKIIPQLETSQLLMNSQKLSTENMGSLNTLGPNNLFSFSSSSSSSSSLFSSDKMDKHFHDFKKFSNNFYENWFYYYYLTLINNNNNNNQNQNISTECVNENISNNIQSNSTKLNQIMITNKQIQSNVEHSTSNFTINQLLESGKDEKSMENYLNISNLEQNSNSYLIKQMHDKISPFLQQNEEINTNLNRFKEKNNSNFQSINNLKNLPKLIHYDNDSNSDFIDLNDSNDSISSIRITRSTNENCNDNDTTNMSTIQNNNYYYDNHSSNSSSISINGINPSNSKSVRLKSIIQTDEDLIANKDLADIYEFAHLFKIRRLNLGLTQTQVGACLNAKEGPAYSQSAICRFEKLDVTLKSARRMKPVLERWLTETEAIHNTGELTSIGGTHILQRSPRKRKRRTCFSSQALNCLLDQLQRNPYPSKNEMNELAKSLTYDREVIRVWFCNRRQAKKSIDN